YFPIKPGLDVGRNTLLATFEHQGADLATLVKLLFKAFMHIELSFVERQRSDTAGLQFNLELSLGEKLEIFNAGADQRSRLLQFIAVQIHLLAQQSVIQAWHQQKSQH